FPTRRSSDLNPFGQYRGVYGQQLMNLMANPGSIVNDPGYKFAFGQGEQAVERSAAAKGFLGSGNEAIALQQYGMGFANDYLHQQEQFLSGLAGANIAPNFGPAMSGYAAGADLSGQGLAGLAYGATRFGGASQGTPAYHPSSAGGEAAALAGDVSTAGAAFNLYKKVAPAFGGPAPSSGLSNTVGALGDIAGIYTGIQRGDAVGYIQAGADVINLAGAAGYDTGVAGEIAGPVGAALAVYNFAENYQSGRTGSDTAMGAEAGAAVGSVIPGIGTVVGAVIGGVIGAASSAFGPGAKDPEDVTFGKYTQAFNKGGANAVAGAPPNATFQALAGLFDLRSEQITGNIPMYQQYGRMGEGKFTSDMMTQINNAITSGKVSSSATPDQIYQQVVMP